MLTKKPYTFTLELDVYDAKSLAEVAEKRAVTNGLDLKDWRAMRKDQGDPISCDLQMLLDPGSLVGCNIQNGYAERSDTEWA